MLPDTDALQIVSNAQLEQSARLASFKADVLEFEPARVVRRHIISGPCSEVNDDTHFEIRERTARQFKIHPNEICIVGSAKLGFSIAPQKRYRSFSDRSDIDIAIVSEPLFLAIWNDISCYNQAKTAWPEQKDFAKYLFKGWIRPDTLPKSSMFPLQAEWFEFFAGLVKTGKCGPYKISGGLYLNWNFLERYQEVCVAQCKHEMELVR